MDISVTTVFEEKKLRQKVSTFIPSAHETYAASAEIAQLKRKFCCFLKNLRQQGKFSATGSRYKYYLYYLRTIKLSGIAKLDALDMSNYFFFTETFT